MRKISLLIALLAWMGVCACCTAPQPTVEYPPIDQLLIDGSAFPKGWEATEPDSRPPPRAPWSGPTRIVEYIDRRLYTRSGDGAAAYIRIQRLDNSRVAAREYEYETDVAFRDTEWNTPWIVPAELSFESSVANQYRYACSMEGKKELAQPVCAYVAQYGVYTVYLNIDIHDTGVITYTDLLPVFQAIDERMATALER